MRLGMYQTRLPHGAEGGKRLAASALRWRELRHCNAASSVANASTDLRVPSSPTVSTQYFLPRGTMCNVSISGVWPTRSEDQPT